MNKLLSVPLYQKIFRIWEEVVLKTAEVVVLVVAAVVVSEVTETMIMDHLQK